MLQVYSSFITPRFIENTRECGRYILRVREVECYLAMNPEEMQHYKWRILHSV